MNIWVNGQPYIIAEKSTLLCLLNNLQLQGKRIAVEVNAQLVVRAEHAAYQLCENDKVEIVHAIGGG